MTEAHIEWQREYVTKYSNINRMKNGLRKSYFYETECQHHKDTLEEVECILCKSLFECCDVCYMDYAESGVNPETYDDLVCPDCLEKCINCNKYITDDNGSRSDVYPYDLYCIECANLAGDTYDEPEELDDNEDATDEDEDEEDLSDDDMSDEDITDDEDEKDK